MQIKQFIEKAIEGGWKHTDTSIEWWSKGEGQKTYQAFLDGKELLSSKKWKHFAVTFPSLISTILLDPLSWKAVGKVEGWGGSATYVCTDTCDWWCNDCGFSLVKQKSQPKEFKRGVHVDCPKAELWKVYFRRLPVALIEGKTIEEFISKL